MKEHHKEHERHERHEHHKEHEKRHRAKGGETGGVDEEEEDLKMKTHDRVSAPEIDKEADERKRGGRAKRKRGGHVERKAGGKVRVHKAHERHEHAKDVEMHGEHAKHHAGRKARKSGGATSDENPFTSARKGTPAAGRKLEMEYE